MMLTDYHAALHKITAEPLTLTEHDFAALEEFNPADERRGRDAMRKAQIALVSALETKGAPVVPVDDPSVFVNALEIAIRRALAPVVARLRALETAAGVEGLVPERDAFQRAQERIDTQCDQQLETFMRDAAAGLVTARGDHRA